MHTDPKQVKSILRAINGNSERIVVVLLERADQLAGESVIQLNRLSSAERHDLAVERKTSASCTQGALAVEAEMHQLLAGAHIPDPAGRTFILIAHGRDRFPVRCERHGVDAAGVMKAH